MSFNSKKEFINHQKYRLWDSADALEHMEYFTKKNICSKRKQLKNIKFKPDKKKGVK